MNNNYEIDIKDLGIIIKRICLDCSNKAGEPEENDVIRVVKTGTDRH